MAIGLIFFVLMLVFFYLDYALYDINRSAHLSKRQKTSFSILAIVLPLVGYLFYLSLSGGRKWSMR